MHTPRPSLLRNYHPVFQRNKLGFELPKALPEELSLKRSNGVLKRL
jgi:hypothetical protein